MAAASPDVRHIAISEVMEGVAAKASEAAEAPSVRDAAAHATRVMAFV